MRDTGITRCAKYLMTGIDKMPDERVLAAPAADYEYSQCLSSFSSFAAFIAAAQLPKYRTAAACRVR
jgi:hypothetical protein